MKLRCTTNSIRMRIRKSELSQLAANKSVEEQIHFGNNTIFSFVLEIHENTEQVAATFFQNNLVVSLPTEVAHEWINSKQVGIEVHHLVAENEQLHILIEKDFPCLDREEEDKSDTFWELSPETPDAC